MDLCRTGAIAAGMLALLATTPALAQQDLRLPAGETFTHPHSHIVIPAEVGGQVRTRAYAYAEDYLDMGINFDSARPGESLSVYVFRNTNGSVPLWFAQAQAALEVREELRAPVLQGGVIAFVPPGQANASGLRAVYAPGSGPFRSTGLALFGSGEWYVKLRATSVSRTPEELSTWMAEVLGSLQVPTGDAPAVVPMTDCANRLRFRGTSRDVRGDNAGASVLMGLVAGLAAARREAGEGEEGTADAAPEAPVTWCRDRVVAPAQTVYRADEADDAYLLAVGDNGNAFRVAPDGLGALLAEDAEDAANQYSVVLVMAGRNINFPPQDRMPAPARVLDLLENNRAVGSVNTWGDDSTININSGAL